MKSFKSGHGALRRLVVPTVIVGLLLVKSTVTWGQNEIERNWGFGWDDGLTLRKWLGARWELSLAAGPDDFLNKSETRSWFLDTPAVQHGLLEIPEDIREEHGWVRFQLGRLVKKKDQFAVTAYGGVVYEWIVHQERSLMLHELNSNYDTFELDRHTQRWILTLGLRPSWQPTSFLTVETAFGLNFIMENWDQTTHQAYSGVEEIDFQELDGNGQQFEDFGFEGVASIQVFVWL